jgi:hypothetical protein
MSKAIYHYEAAGRLVSKEFEVLKTHADGTVDLGPAGGEARVTNCSLTAQPVNGSATVFEAKAEKPKDEKPKDEKPKDEKPKAPAK